MSSVYSEQASRGRALLRVLIVFIILGGCALFLWGDRFIAIRDSDTSLPSTLNQDQPCLVRAEATTTIYTRPDIRADAFGELNPHQQVTAAGKTGSGWVGFEPGVAQAPNVGSFRLRYIPPKSAVTLLGSCDTLPVVAAIPPDTCFAMLQTNSVIYKNPDASSTSVTKTRFGDYLEATAQKGKEPDVWIKVQSPVGTLASGTAGWLPLSDINFNGVCDLPTAK